MKHFVDHIHQVIYNMILTKDLDRKLYYYIYTWDLTLDSVVWAIKACYHHSFGLTPVQAIFGRDMLLIITSLVYWYVVTSINQRQVDIDNSCKKSRLVRHDYAAGNIVYVEK